MVQPRDLAAFCNDLLDSGSFEDYCPNGLQVEGTRPIRRLATGVTASLALLEAAAEWDADAVLVHHGYFWKGEPEPLVGMKGDRIRALFRRDMSLIAYHLPLDGHPTLGNNAQLAMKLGLEAAPPEKATELLWQTELNSPESAEEMSRRIADALNREPLVIEGGAHPIRRVAWCTGGAQSYLDGAADAGADAFITGEISEHSVHTARERSIHFFAAGHHATERYGVQALGGEIARIHDIECRYFEVDNPV